MNGSIRARHHHSKCGGYFNADPDGRNRDIGVAFTVKMHHLLDVHAIDVVCRKDCDKVRAVPHDEIEVPENGVGGALEGSRAAIDFRKHELY